MSDDKSPIFWDVTALSSCKILPTFQRNAQSPSSESKSRPSKIWAYCKQQGEWSRVSESLNKLTKYDTTEFSNSSTHETNFHSYISLTQLHFFLTTEGHMWTDCLENVGASTSHNPNEPLWPVTGIALAFAPPHSEVVSWLLDRLNMSLQVRVLLGASM
jgi:hypothetical protein